MKRVFNLIVLLVVAAGFGASLFLFQRVVGITSPWFILIVMQSFLGLVAFARPLFLLRMPPLLRDLRPWESKGGLYSKLGVPAFGGLLRRTPLRYLNPLVYLNQSSDDSSAVSARLESAEAAHLWAAVLITPYMIYAGFQNWFIVVAWFIVFQIAGNLYPILHLRLARRRLHRYLEKKSMRRSTQDAPSTEASS